MSILSVEGTEYHLKKMREELEKMHKEFMDEVASRRKEIEDMKNLIGLTEAYLEKLKTKRAKRIKRSERFRQRQTLDTLVQARDELARWALGANRIVEV